MSTGINMSTKLPENPLDEPSSLAVAARIWDYTTVPVSMYTKISAISNRGAVEMDEVIFIKTGYMTQYKKVSPWHTASSQ